MEPPVKDRDTIPWIDPAEIPAVKIMLSAWRKLRKDKGEMSYIRKYVGMFDNDLENLIDTQANLVARAMVKITIAEDKVNESHGKESKGSKRPQNKAAGK